MTVEEIRLLTGNHLDSTWATCTPIKRPNRKFMPPQNSAWIEYRVLPGTVFEGEINGGVGIRTGVIQIHVSIPEGSGTRSLADYCARLEAGFRHQKLTTKQGKRLITGEAETRELGPDGAWFKYCVTVTFNAFVGD